MIHILDQGEIWIDKDKIEHRIAEMPGAYALNVYEFLKRNHRITAFKYSLEYLISIPMPDLDTAAYDIVADEVEREQERIAEYPLDWLLDKPLMKALVHRITLDRVEKGTYAKIEVEPQSVLLPEGTLVHELPEFEVAAPPQISAEGKQRPGDETKVFVVTTGQYSDMGIAAVFVGNREAAYRWSDEWDRYHSYSGANVEEWDDLADGGSKVYGQKRRYHPAYTEVHYSTSVNLNDASASTHGPTAGVRHGDPNPQVVTDIDHHPSGRHPTAYVNTRGPDTKIEQIRKAHSEAVARVRVAVIETQPMFTQGDRP